MAEARRGHGPSRLLCGVVETCLLGAVIIWRFAIETRARDLETSTFERSTRTGAGPRSDHDRGR